MYIITVCILRLWKCHYCFLSQNLSCNHVVLPSNTIHIYLLHLYLKPSSRKRSSVNSHLFYSPVIDCSYTSPWVERMDFTTISLCYGIIKTKVFINTEKQYNILVMKLISLTSAVLHLKMKWSYLIYLSQSLLFILSFTKTWYPLLWTNNAKVISSLRNLLFLLKL